MNELNEVDESALRNIAKKRYKCANCCYIYDYVIKVGDYISYANECVKCKSTALDEIQKDSKNEK